ncbi:beta-ketoacyl synthase N-terminal-like domain-containing protein [Micromonospora globbae]|uniref:Beta-ketoacyl synthase n=1 Tax=Micromonospora globbae TaxID=1894969 RepID=A0ABZ1SDH7_9ACTN|nr:beta-ketoacyl synthase N-terminal-like domain-containing protein [Micromonospora globbae]
MTTLRHVATPHPAATAGLGPRAAAGEPVAAVLAAALHLPGVDALPADLPGARAATVEEPACPPERAADLLGRKGLLAKEPATRLALCAVHRALGLPAKAPRRTGPADPRTAVVVSSNLGNVATVGDIARRLRDGGPREVGPLEAPNASSNVIAGAVAIWFRFGGPNLTVCSGATAGLDAIWLAGLLLRTGRADRVVVVGTEPDDAQARALHAARRGRADGRPLRAGAACLLLGPVDGPGEPLGLLGPVRAVGADGASPAAPGSADDTVPGSVDGDVPGSVDGTVPGPVDGAVPGSVDGVPPAAPRLVDDAVLPGDHYGAAGVVHTAVALRLLAGTPAVRVRCGDPADGFRELTVTGAGR